MCCLENKYFIHDFLFLSTVKYLVAHGADIEVANRHGHTCLMISCYKGHYAITKFLLGLKANVNRKSVKGEVLING